MKKLIFVLIAALGVSCTSYAQMTEKEIKKATKEAKKLVTEAKKEMERQDVVDKSNAKRLIDQAIKSPYVKDWYLTWYEAAEIYHHLYAEEKLKANSQQKYDTVGCYNNLLKWYRYDFIADSLEHAPSNGKITNETRTNHARGIYNTVDDLIRAGIFYFNDHSDYKKAYQMFDTYFKTAENDLCRQFSDIDTIYHANKGYFAYFAALSAYKLEDWPNTLKYAEIAKDDETNGELATEMICDAYGMTQDTVKWLETLKYGINKYPTKEFFYVKLMNYYNLKNDLAALEEFILNMIQLDPERADNYYVLGIIAHQNKEYKKAIEQYNIAIEKNPEHYDAIFNLGLCIMLQADDEMESKSNLDYRSAAYKKAIQDQKDSYKQALPYFLKYREAKPESVTKWGIPLQAIYYTLNMTKELNEVESRMKEEGML